MFLLPNLRPKTLEDIARQPDDTERLAKREAEQIAKLEEIRDYKRDALTPGQPPRAEESEESEEEEEEEEDDDDGELSGEEDEDGPPEDIDDQSMSDDGMEQLVP